MEEQKDIKELKTLKEEYENIKNILNNYTSVTKVCKQNQIMNVIEVLNKLCSDLVNTTTNAINYCQEVEDKNFILKCKLLKLLKEKENLYKAFDEKVGEIVILQKNLDIMEEKIDHLEKLNEIRVFYEQNI